MADYRQEAPPILQEFLNYHESILSHSAKTVDEYFLDLRSFSAISNSVVVRNCNRLRSKRSLSWMST